MLFARSLFSQRHFVLRFVFSTKHSQSNLRSPSASKLAELHRLIISLTDHSLLRKPTVKGLPCGEFAINASYNTILVVFPRLNAGYRSAVCTSHARSPVRGAKKSKSFDLDFFICAACTTSFDRRSTSFRAQREHHSAFMRTQTNDVAASRK